MADAKSNTAEQMTLDWLLGGSNPTRPSARYVALHTADPTDAGTGSEVSGGSYARQSATFSAAATDSGVTTSSNTADLNWTNLPTSTVTHIGIWSASTGGYLLYSAPLAQSKAITSGDELTISAGGLVAQEK